MHKTDCSNNRVQPDRRAGRVKSRHLKRGRDSHRLTKRDLLAQHKKTKALLLCLQKVCAITPGRANNSPDCLLFARSNPLLTKIKRKTNKSTCALFGVE